MNAVSTMDWHEVARSIEASRKLLEALWKMDEAAVAKGVEPVSYTHLDVYKRQQLHRSSG